MPPPFGAEFGNGSLRQGLILSPASFFAPMNQRPATSSWSSTFTLDPEIHKKERACNARRMCYERSCLIAETVGTNDNRANCVRRVLHKGPQTVHRARRAHARLRAKTRRARPHLAACLYIRCGQS